MKSLVPILAALAALVPLAAPADTGRLSDMLRMIPQAALPPGAPRIDIFYGNGDAVRGVARNGNLAWPADDWAHDYAAARAAPPAQAAALEAGEGEALSLYPRDWVHALEVSAPPARMGVHFLFPDSEMRLRGALFSGGLDVATRGGAMVLWEGAEDHAADPARVSDTDPFGGAEGLSRRFVVEGEWALWATGWPQIEAMLAGGGATLADVPGVAQAVAGLDQAVRRYGNLVSAQVSVDLSGAGLPEWPEAPLAGAILADVVNRREEAAILGLMFRPGTDGEAIAEAFRARWGGSMLARWGTEPGLVALPGVAPGFLLVIEGGWGEDEAASNDALASLLRARENGTLAALLAAP